MYKNGLSYTIITLLSLLTHISMLTIVFIKGQYDSIMSVSYTHLRAHET